MAGTRNSSMGSPNEGSIRRPIAPWANALTTELHLAPGFTMKDRSDDPSYHERTLLPRSYISLLGSPWRIDPTTHRTMSERSYHRATSRSWVHHEGSIRRPIAPSANALTTELRLAPGFTMKDRSDDPSYHERTLLPRSYISLLGSPWRIDPTTHRTMSERSYHGATSRSWVHHEGSIRRPIAPWANALTTELHLAPGFTMKDRSDDPSHHERTLLPRSYISPLLSNRSVKYESPCVESVPELLSGLLIAIGQLARHFMLWPTFESGSLHAFVVNSSGSKRQ